MADTVDSIQKIFRGALLILLGFLGGGVLTLGLQILLARYFHPDVYGVFSQGMSVLYTLVMISMLGLNAGVSRHISFNNQDEEEASKAVGSSLAVTVPLSLIIFSLLFLKAELIAEQLFGDSQMIQVLKIFAVAGPAMAINSLFISGFRGRQSSKERVVILDFAIPFLQILAVSIMVFAGYNIGGAVAGYASAFLISCLGITYFYRSKYSISFSKDTLEELVKLSWPIMISAAATQIFIWSPPIIVGILSSSRDAGLLNTALPLASSSKMFLSSIAFLYLPVVSEIYGNEEKQELTQVHGSATRWITYLALPILGFLLLNSSSSIRLIFGDGYAAAGAALSVMTIGYLFNSMTGPLGELLIAIGKTRKEMLSNIAKIVLFTSIAVLTIPEYGLLGAAVAYSIGIVSGDIIRLFFAKEEVGQFYSLDFMKPFIGVLISAIATSIVSQGLIIEIITWSLIYTLSLGSLNPLNEVDRKLISRPLEKYNINHPALTKVLDMMTG